jgi:peptidyl-prolyl cis-trans isomerase C
MQMKQKLLASLIGGMLIVGCAESGTDNAAPQPTTSAEAPAQPAAEAAPLGAETLVEVNGENIDRAALAIFLREKMKAKPGADIPPQIQSAALNDLINVVLLAQAAEQRGLTARADVSAALQLQRDQLLARLTAADYTSNFTPSDADVEKLYAEQIGTQPKTEYKARHILLKTEDEAKAVIAELDKGADFSELAKAHSTGPSASDGGDLGWFQSGQMVKPFSDAVAELKKGSYTKEPVHTQFGWHVIILDDQREQAPPTLDQARPKLISELKQRSLGAYVTELQKSAKIRINEINIKRAEPGGGDAASTDANATPEEQGKPETVAKP